MVIFQSRQEALDLLESNHKKKIVRLNQFYDLLDLGLRVGVKIDLKVPATNVKGEYMITYVDAFNYVIELRPMKYGGTVVRNLVEIILLYKPNTRITIKN